MRRPELRDILVLAALCVVVGYGALLRLDALTMKYGPVRTPAWLETLQQSRGDASRLRPHAVRWDPVPSYPHRDGVPTRYRSDPYTYLQYAREQQSFYAAHHREPVFPFVTRLFLSVLDQDDVAVSFASAAFSLAAIVATYLVGALAVSRPVGLAAALALSIEYEVVSWSVEGWRDDAFTCFVVLSAYTMLRYWRAPDARNALLLGVVAGLACLVRITSLSFLVPGFAVLLATGSGPWRARAREIGLAVLVGAAVAGPYLVNCWLTFGDPLHAINVHADVYRATEGQAIGSSQTAREYIGQQFRDRPARTLDTLVLGMTSYPFTNKWQGFDPWNPSLGTWLARGALLGLVLLVGSPAGRLLLIVLAGSLVPYALTWHLLWDWRFTAHAYPFFLLASFFAIARIVTLVRPSTFRASPGRGWPPQPLLALGATLAVCTPAVWIALWVLPVFVFQESLQAGENVSIAAGGRDRPFFVRGWAPPTADGNVTTRAARSSSALIHLPLPRSGDYGATLRIDPAPRPSCGDTPALPRVRVFVNNRSVAVIDLSWDPERVGSYDFQIPAGVSKRGRNRVLLVSEPTSSFGAGFTVWYLRVRPGVGPSVFPLEDLPPVQGRLASASS